MTQPPITSLSFTHEKNKISYRVFSLGDAHEIPTATIGEVGDLATGTDVIWVRHPHEWKKSLIGNDGEGRPLQRHPLFNRRRLYEVYWKSDKKSKPEASCSQVDILDAPTIQPYKADKVSMISPQPSTYSGIRPGNEWLRGVLDEWNSPPISRISSLHKVGKAIIEKLLSSSKYLPDVPKDELTMKLLGKPTRGPIPPSTKLALVDLMAPGIHNVCEFFHRSSESGIRGLDVIASMINPTTLCDMDAPERRLYGALEIPMTKEGLALCEYEAFPYHDQKESLVPKNSWTTTFTPPGAITHTHMDCYGRHQYIVHLFGRKLWLLWPPTDENLKKFSPFYLQTSTTDTTLRCIDELDGLQVFYTDKEQSFVLRPNVLHACLCIGTSGHSGAWLWTLPAYEESLRMVSWGLIWMKGRLSTDAPAGDYKDELDILQSELNSWRELVKLNPENPYSTDVNCRLEALEKELSGLTAQFNPTKRANKRKRA